MTGFGTFTTMPLAGGWREGQAGKTGTDTDPWTGDTLTEIPLASAEDLDEAFRGAAAAQRDWGARPPAQRAEVMLAAARIMAERKKEVTGWVVRESGGTLTKAGLEWQLVQAGMLEAASVPHHVTGSIMPSDIPGKESRVYRQPAGVVAVISPWNFPLLSVVVGSGGDIGDAMVSHPVPSVVSFTGSTSVGQGIVETAGIKRLSLELGGNGPLVVLDDADLDAAVDAAVFGSFCHAGQVRMIANRLVVDLAVYDEFVSAFTERVRDLRADDPADASTDIGPVVSSRQLSSVMDKVDRAVSAGAKQVLGGEPSGPAGLLLPPHVLLGENGVATAKEEVFGPVITIIPAADEADALAIANDTEYGLSSAVFTRDAERGVAFALSVEAGMTHVNDSPVNDDANTAFGGVKASGIGRFGGQWAIEEFTTGHWVSVQREPRSFPIPSSRR